MRSVLLLKSPKPKDPYLEQLGCNGYHATCIPALSFQYINIDELNEKLKSPSSYVGLVLTSQNSVEACRLAQVQSTLDLSGWKEKKNYVVGESTFNKAKEVLDLICEGADTGNGANLAKLITADLAKSANSRLLYPKTSLKTTDLVDQLSQSGFLVDVVEVYNTLPDPEFINNISRYLQSHDCPDVIVFFSPSGVDFCLQHITRLINTQPKYIAVGPSTSTALSKAGISDYKTLTSPTPQSLLNCLAAI